MSISTVVFDFGNVVGFFSHEKAAEQLSAYTDMSPAEITAAYVRTNLEDEFEAGRIGAAEFRLQLRDLCRLHCTDAELDRAMADMFSPNPEICELIPRLKKRYRLVLLSNTNPIHAGQFLRQFADTLAHFDLLILSHEVRIRKPNQRIYCHTHEKAGVLGEHCVFIDDIAENIEGAKSCGWGGVVYRPGGNLRQTLAAVGIVVE